MEKAIKKIEDMSLNAWPSHKMELYDGWILRFSYFYTHRTNSVEQFGTSTLPWREKIPYCEQVYKRLGTPAIFKISPLVSQDFDYMLENRGYSIQHVTNVMTVDLDKAVLDAPVTDVLFTNEIPDFWIHSLFDLKKTTNPIHRSVVPSMYRAILKETVCAQKTARSLPLGLEFWTVTISVSMQSMYVKITAAEDMPVRSAPVFSMKVKKEVHVTLIFRW